MKRAKERVTGVEAPNALSDGALLQDEARSKTRSRYARTWSFCISSLAGGALLALAAYRQARLSEGPGVRGAKIPEDDGPGKWRCNVPMLFDVSVSQTMSTETCLAMKQLGYRAVGVDSPSIADLENFLETPTDATKPKTPFTNVKPGGARCGPIWSIMPCQLHDRYPDAKFVHVTSSVETSVRRVQEIHCRYDYEHCRSHVQRRVRTHMWGEGFKTFCKRQTDLCAKRKVRDYSSPLWADVLDALKLQMLKHEEDIAACIPPEKRLDLDTAADSLDLAVIRTSVSTFADCTFLSDEV